MTNGRQHICSRALVESKQRNKMLILIMHQQQSHSLSQNLLDRLLLLLLGVLFTDVMLTTISRDVRGSLMPVDCVKDSFIAAHSLSSELNTEFSTQLSYASHNRKRDIAEVLHPPLIRCSHDFAVPRLLFSSMKMCRLS